MPLSQNDSVFATMFTFGARYKLREVQGRTDPMDIRAMPWGPPPKGAHQTFKNNSNQQISVTKTAVHGAPW